VIVALFLVFLVLYEVKGPFLLKALRETESRFLKRLVYFAVFFPCILLVSHIFSSVGFEVNLLEEVVVSLIAAFSFVVAQEIWEVVKRKRLVSV